MSILRVDKILSYLEEEEVHVLGLRIGDFPIEMNTATEVFVKNGTCVYQDDKFKFKQNNEWITIGDEIFSLDLKTDGGGVITVSSEDSISISSGSSAIHTYATLDPSGTPKIGIAWKAGLHQLSVDSPGDPPSGHPGNVRDDMMPSAGDIFQWDPDGAGAGVGHWDAIGAGAGPSSGDVLTWSGTEWSANPVPITGDVFSVLDGTPMSRQITVITDDTCKEITNSLAAIDMVGNISSPSSIQGEYMVSTLGTWCDTLRVKNAAVVGHVLTCTSALLGNAEWQPPSGGGGADNLGNHIATENLQMSGHWISESGSDEGLKIHSGGTVGINSSLPVSNVVLDIKDAPDGTSGNVRLESGRGITFGPSAVSNPRIYSDPTLLNNLRLSTGSRRIELDRLGHIGLGVWADLEADADGLVNINKDSVGHEDAGLYIHGDDDDIDFIKCEASGGAQRFRVTGEGDVGVGTGLPRQSIDIKSNGGLDSVSFAVSGALLGEVLICEYNLTLFRSFQAFITVADHTPITQEFMTTTVTVLHDGKGPVFSSPHVHHTEHGVITARFGTSPWVMTNGFLIKSNIVGNMMQLSIKILGSGDTFEGNAVITGLRGA